MTTPSAPSVALRFAAARVASGVYFHGTSEEAARKIMQQGFSLRGVGQRQRAVHGDDTLDPKGVFVTSDLMQARWYAGPDPKRPGLNRGGAVVEVKVSGRMMSESDWWESKRRISEEMGITGLYDPRRGEVVLRAQEEAKKQGYAGFHEHGDEYVVFDPKNVKPVRAFHAGSGEPLSKTASRIDAPPVMLREITEWVWSLMASEILRNVERVRGHRKNPIRWQRTVDFLGEDEAWGTLVDLAETERLAKKYGGKMPSGPLPKAYTKDFPVDLRGWKHERYVKDLLDEGKGSPLARMFMDHPITVQWVTSPRHAPSRVRGPGGSTPKGTWDAIGLLRLFMSAPYGTDPRMIKRQMEETARVVRHELQHLAQTVLENATNLDTAGMPAGGERGRVSPHSSTEDEHALRDVEFYTRLQDDIDEFLSLRGKFGPAGDDRVTRKAIGVWVGEEPAQDVGMWSLRPSRFFTELRKHDRRKYRKAVGEFWSAVSEGGTPSYRFASGYGEGHKPSDEGPPAHDLLEDGEGFAPQTSSTTPTTTRRSRANSARSGPPSSRRKASPEHGSRCTGRSRASTTSSTGAIGSRCPMSTRRITPTGGTCQGRMPTSSRPRCLPAPSGGTGMTSWSGGTSDPPSRGSLGRHRPARPPLDPSGCPHARSRPSPRGWHSGSTSTGCRSPVG